MPRKLDFTTKSTILYIKSKQTKNDTLIETFSAQKCTTSKQITAAQSPLENISAFANNHPFLFHMQICPYRHSIYSRKKSVSRFIASRKAAAHLLLLLLLLLLAPRQRASVVLWLHRLVAAIVLQQKNKKHDRYCHDTSIRIPSIYNKSEKNILYVYVENNTSRSMCRAVCHTVNAMRCSSVSVSSCMDMPFSLGRVILLPFWRWYMLESRC